MKNTILLSIIVLFTVGVFAQDTLYIYENGGIVSKRAIANIDSIIFYMPTPTCGQPFTDTRDGNVYQTVLIGKQCWMKENLRYSYLPTESSNSAWIALTTPAFCWYNNNSSNANPYGALYNWYAVNTGTLCPTGWHVPGDAEWDTLNNYLGGISLSGGALKEAGTSHWQTPNTGATNTSGFTAIPTGYRNRMYGYFDLINKLVYYWSSDEIDTGTAWVMRLEYNHAATIEEVGYKNGGASVRCIKD